MKVIKFVLIFLVGFSCLSLAEQDISKPLHLTLKSSMLLASKENPQIFAANERVRQALANIAASRADLLPQLTASFGGKRQTEDLRASGIKLPGNPHIGPFNSFDARGRLTMDIIDPSAIKRLDSAKAGEKLSHAELLKVREDILAMVGSLFLEAQRSSQAVILNQFQLKQAEYQYQIASVQLKQGTGSILDLNRYQADLAQAQYILEASKVHAQQTSLDLASALELPLDQSIIFDEDQAWINKDLQKYEINPDLVVAQAQLDQAKTNESVARADFWPKIVASGDYGRSGESPNNSSSTYSLGIAVNFSIWEGGSKQAQLKSARSKTEEQKILLADAQSQDQVKLREAKNNVDQAKALLIAKMKQFSYTDHQEKLAEFRLKSGLGSRLDMDQVLSIEAIALDEKNEAQAVYLTAKIDLARAYGNIEELFEIKQGDLK